MSTSEGKEYKARQMDPQIKSILKAKDRANNSCFFLFFHVISYPFFTIENIFQT